MITTLCGENDAERLREQARIVDAFVAEHTDMGLERIDGDTAAYDRMLEAVQSLPFLVSRKLVVLHGPSLNKDFIERFEDFSAAAIEQTDVLIIEGKLDKRTAYYRQLKKLTDFHEFAVLDAPGLAAFAVRYAKEQGGSLQPADARYLVERTGTNQLSLQHELDKLFTYEPKIVRAAIDLLTDEVPQSKIFDLLDAAFAGDTRRLLALYADQRAQEVEPQQIVAMLVWQLYIFVVIKAGQGKSAAELAKAARLNPYVVEKSQRVLRNLPMARLRQMVTDLRTLDVRSKSEGIVLDEALQHYLLNLAA